jgi:hypothetical protein
LLEGLTQLLELQRLDDDLASFEKEHEGLPERRVSVETRRSDAATRNEQAKEQLTTAEVAMRTAEAGLQDSEALLVKLESQQNQVKTNDAYSALLREIEQAKNEISDRETAILEAMDGIETANAVLSEAASAHGTAVSELDRENKEIDAREVELRGLIDGHRERRTQVGPSVAEELLRIYERISKRRTPAVVVVTNELCGGCRVGIPAQDFIEILRGEKVVTCGNCTRILLHAEKLDPAAEEG